MGSNTPAGVSPEIPPCEPQGGAVGVLAGGVISVIPDAGLALGDGDGVGVGRGVGGAVGGATADAAGGGWIVGTTGRSAAVTSAGRPGGPPLTGEAGGSAAAAP